jgi:hypothetical protein
MDRQRDMWSPEAIVAHVMETVYPMVARRFPDAAADMSIRVMGSCGLGVQDDLSDLEVSLLLKDDLWQSQGGRVQLLLSQLPQFAPRAGQEFVVQPVSSLKPLSCFLQDGGAVPWEDLSSDETMVRTYCVREELVLRDPHRIYEKLRDATDPRRVPAWFWKKPLLTKLDEMYWECDQLELGIARGNAIEAMLATASFVEKALCVGFLVDSQYYAPRKHIRWAFEKLSSPAAEVLAMIDKLLASRDWQVWSAQAHAIAQRYIQHIKQNRLLPEVDFDAPSLPHEVMYAQRHKAWSNSDWHDRVALCEEEARRAGCDARHFWIWDKWGWV